MQQSPDSQAMRAAPAHTWASDDPFRPVRAKNPTGRDA
jgi:hypothetical protein